MSSLSLGLVSNCWRIQLSAGAPLDTLIAEAIQRGYQAIELRQTCLGRYESGEPPLPDAEALAALAARFSEVQFNLALSVGFLNAEVTPNDPVFSAGRLAAAAISGGRPHLRLVDLRTAAEHLEVTSIETLGSAVARFARELIEIDGTLSVEHSIQPWKPFRDIFLSARRELGVDADRLQLCYDPVNLLLPADGVDPVEVTASLSADEISMVHFKQRRAGRIVTSVCDGEIDWSAQLKTLEQIGYQGLYLFEVESDEKLWEYLADSREYLRQRGFQGEASR